MMLIFVGRLPSPSSKIDNYNPRGAARSHSALVREDHEGRRRQSPGSLHRLRNRNRHFAAVHRTSRRVEIYGPKARDRARPTMGDRGRARSSSRVVRPPLDCEAIRLSLISHGTCRSATPFRSYTLSQFTRLLSVSLSQPLARLPQRSSIRLLTCPR